MRLAILNSDPKECTYGGVAPIMQNMHPYLSQAFDVEYFFLPGSWLKVPGPHRIKVLIYLWLRKRSLKKADFILSHIPEGSVIASCTRVPYAHVYHGNANPMETSRFRYGKLFAPLYRSFYNRIEKTAAFRYTVGPASGTVKKLMNPILHDVQPKPVGDRSGFIYAGRLEAFKNIDRLIRIYAQLPDSLRKGNDLFIAGSGTQEEALKKLVRDMALESRVHFLGRLSNKDLIEEDSRHLLFLMASLREGMPTAIAEALSVGLPVITTEAGDIPAVIRTGENGFLLPKDCSDEDYIDCISRALSDYEALSLQARESAKMFDAERITHGVISDIKQYLQAQAR